MDALDVKILRTMGVKPFVTSPWRPRSLKPTDTARTLGKSVQVVKDRLARMETDGVITGYRALPNLRHCGLDLALFHVLADTLPDRKKLSRLSAVDGLVGVLWFYGGDVCIDLCHASKAELSRRLDLVTDLIGATHGPLPLYDRALPDVKRRLTPLDWRILRAVHRDARRPLPEVAEEVGVTTKTVRTRLHAMRVEGSIDEYVELDYTRMMGLIPFNLAAWSTPGGPDPTPKLLSLFHDRYLLRFPGPPVAGPPTFLAQLFAYTPAEIQSLLGEASRVEGVQQAATLLPTGGYYNDAWVRELIEARATGTASDEAPPPLPKPQEVVAKREILS